ncbi:MAG TPA: pantoate--beta-alanine ligase, partial [Trebonia sp.]
ARAKLTGPVVLVPTMGALHEGHRALLRRARSIASGGAILPIPPLLTGGSSPPVPPRGGLPVPPSPPGGDKLPKPGSVVVSIFVNPLQFGPNEDLDRYPRTLPADLALAEAEGVDLVFAPGVSDMYPREQLVTVDPGPVGDILEGEFRPGFFKGVLTVVLKLFTLVGPDIAVFGQKDAQQLAMVRRMVEDFALDIRIEGIPTVRAGDGLALSSRNKYLSRTERIVATLLNKALSAGSAAAPDGPRAVLEAARAVLEGAGDALVTDYVELADFESGRPVRDDGFAGTATLAVAARVGTTRLIDNVPVRFHAADD